MTSNRGYRRSTTPEINNHWQGMQANGDYMNIIFVIAISALLVAQALIEMGVL